MMQNDHSQASASSGPEMPKTPVSRPIRQPGGFSRPAGVVQMLALLLLACNLEVTPAGCQQAAGSKTAPAPNWTTAGREELREAEEADAREPHALAPQEIGFSFTLKENVRSTSAGVYDAQGRLIRTLWSARPYPAGAHHEHWDGKDDSGRPVAGGRFTIKLVYGNVRYDWEGVIGVTEASLAGPNNWDGAGSFPSSLAFLNGKAYVGGGYNEARLEAFVFDERDPYIVSPLNMALQSGGQFEYAATDGHRIYFAALHSCCQGSDAVVAFNPNGQPYSFPQGTVIPPIQGKPAYFSNTEMRPALMLKDVRGIDVGSYKAEILTGMAVQRNGNLLATAHGAHGGGLDFPSLDRISLWDKNTGAPAGAIEGIHSPQKMAFDLRGDLWVIEGGPVAEWHWDRGARLARVRGVGAKNEITEPITGLENPVDVAVSPVDGHIFVADGGTSQQVKEFDPETGRLVATVGTPGGYGFGDGCNANMSPTTLWLDYNARATGVTMPWIAVDDSGDLWIGDFTASRILQFHLGRYQRQIEMSRWLYQVSVPRNNPTRVFGGINGMLEYQVKYNVPLLPGDPSAPGGNGAWRPVRNWYPCFLQAEAGQQPGTTASMISTETFSNGQTIGAVIYHGGPFNGKSALLSLPESGHAKVENNRVPGNSRIWFDPAGSYYRLVGSITGGAATYALRKFSVAGFDAQGFPKWDDGVAIGQFQPDAAKGNPAPACWYDGCDFMPSAGGIIPIYAGPHPSAAAANGGSAFHLGGLPVNGTALAWQTQPERPIRYPDGRGTFTTQSKENLAYEARAINRDIFTAINGNWQQFSCQFFHYREDGLLVGQFGWRGSDEYPFIGTGGGYPDPRLGQPLAPGFCGNALTFKIVEVARDYYMYVSDEGYRAGIHRWHISNLDSVRELSGAASPGGSTQLNPLP